MFIIIGLGNPGEKYLGTRHNLGFEFLDKLKTEWRFPDFQLEKKFNAEISKSKFEKQEVLLIKPQTFVNLSGDTILRILHFYKILPENILVIHDDKDINFGEYRLATDSSSAGHNGVQNIINLLGTQKFKRFRIGIGIKTDLPPESFVLQKFSAEEREQLEKIFPEVLEKIKEII